MEFARTSAYPRPSLRALKKALAAPGWASFVIVRHPLQRILASYRDKLESDKQRYYR